MKARYLFLLVGFVTLGAYLPVVRHDFVSYDDPAYVLKNERVLAGLSAANALWAVRSCGYADNWHPLAWISLQADASVVRLWRGEVNKGTLAHVMHAHSVALHAANAALLFVLLLLLVGDGGSKGGRGEFGLVAALVAGLWAIHPLRTEVVCWISERKELLSVFFMLLTMIFWVKGSRGRFCRSGEDTDSALGFALHYLIMLICFALALLAKPVAVTLPAALFAWDWVICGVSFRRAVMRVLPFGLMSAGACVLTLAAQGDAVHVGMQFSIWQKIVMSLNAPVIYLRQTFCPVGLSVHYPVDPPSHWPETLVGLMLVFAMAWVCLRWLRRRESWSGICAFGVAWVYVALLPMLGIVKVGDQSHSDRYTYWAGCAFVSVGLMAAKRLVSGHERDVVKVLGVLLVVSFFATRDRAAYWRDSLTLYSDSVPKSWAEHPVCALAIELRRHGDEGRQRAEWMLREALGHVDYPGIHAEFAHLLAMKAEKSPILFHDGPDPAFAEARFEAQIALAGNPNLGRAHEALGVIAMKECKWDEAIKFIAKAGECGEEKERIDFMMEICREKMKKGTIRVQGK